MTDVWANAILDSSWAIEVLEQSNVGTNLVLDQVSNTVEVANMKLAHMTNRVPVELAHAGIIAAAGHRTMSVRFCACANKMSDEAGPSGCVVDTFAKKRAVSG